MNQPNQTATSRASTAATMSWGAPMNSSNVFTCLKMSALSSRYTPIEPKYTAAPTKSEPRTCAPQRARLTSRTTTTAAIAKIATGM